MNKTIKKIFKFSLAILLFTFVITLTIENAVHAGSTEIYYISASVGETYDNVGIKYHCNQESSVVRYGTDAKLTTYETIESTSTSWSIAQTADPQTGFDARYVCEARLKNLSANTKYYYQVVAGTNKSDIMSFTTPDNGTGKSSILFVTDTQSGDLATFQRVNKVITMLKSKATSPELAVITGDIIDRGGYSAQWNAYFNGINAFNDMLLATIPGNHEYYHDSNAGYIDASFYNQFFYNPQNGPENRMNSSYYFKYDNVLFIMLDVIGDLGSTTDDIASMNAHKAWFREVVKNNPSQWIIVGSHAGVYSAGAYASDASTMRKNFKDLFEECQVDLALSGHEHIYIRNDLVYGSTDDPDLGVTYLVGPAAGQKQYAASDTTGLEEVIAQNQCYSGNILNFDGDKLTVDYYLEDGTLRTSFTLNAKRTAEIQTVTNDEVKESINFTYEASENRVYVTWTEKLWRNALNVALTGSMKWSSAVMSSYSNKHTIRNVYDGNDYNFKLSITMNDGSVVEKDYELLLSPQYKSYAISYDPGKGEMPSTYPTIYENSKGLTDLPVPTRSNYVFKGWYMDGTKYKTIPAMTSMDLNLTAEWFRGDASYEIKYNLDGGTLPSDAPTSYVTFQGLETLPTPTKQGYKFLGWYKDDVLVTSITDEDTKKVTLNAKWEKVTVESSIAYNLDGGTNEASAPTKYIEGTGLTSLPTPTKDGYTFSGWKLNGVIVSSISSTQTGDVTLTAEWAKKKGCKKSSGEYIVSMISAMSLLSLVLLKKKH